MIKLFVSQFVSQSMKKYGKLLEGIVEADGCCCEHFVAKKCNVEIFSFLKQKPPSKKLGGDECTQLRKLPLSFGLVASSSHINKTGKVIKEGEKNAIPK